MYLKAIKANGFKSFADKVNITLDNNITCVVGPNGSGKSNIVDAIKWVLGEQSVKTLRGSNSMTDVIFAGSKTRNEAPRAEVSLIFSNEDKYLNTDFNEIEVRRVLYRSGESEYFINNSKVRCKDITDLFLDSGASNDSFNIISQGSIESVINSKPYERRIIFESASGVSKYKKRKEESLRKLERTKENIEKINLVIDELKTTIEPLKEQSENAKKYLELKEELSHIEIATITDEITKINENYTSLKQEIDILNAKILEIDTENSTETSNLEKLKLQNIKLDEEITKTNAKLLDLTSKFMNLQKEKIIYNERKKYNSKSESLDNNVVVLKEQILENDKFIEILNNEVNNIRNEIKKYSNELANINEEESFSKIKRNSLNMTRENNLKKIFELKNKKSILESNIETNVKVPYAVKSILNNPRFKDVFNTISKLIEVSDEYAMPLDIALGASANFIVVKNEDTAKECINYLKDNKLGRATFFPLNIIKGRSIPNELLEKLQKEEGYIGPLANLVSFDEQFKNVITSQIGNVVVVKDIEAMKNIGKLLEYKYRVVSLTGEIMHTGGSLTGGIDKTSSFIADRRELENLINQLSNLEKEINKNDEELAKFSEEIKILNDKEEELNRNIINLRETEKEKSNLIEAKKNKLAELNQELEGVVSVLKGDIDEKMLTLLELVNEAEKEKNITEENLEKLKEEKNDLVNKISETEKIYREKNSNYNKLQLDLKNNEVMMGKLDIKLDNLLEILRENYNLTYEKAKLEYILDEDIEIAKNKVNTLKNQINRLGDVNVFSIEEYERVSTRFNFLNDQITDLNNSSANLENVIKEMDNIMIEKFTTTFEAISKEFKMVFKKLFKGGNGILKLTDPHNILETGIEIIAEPPGKKLNSIGLLSGGEKTLTAISLLFAILNVKTVPFCVLDEIEAALDEANVDAFGKYLQEQKSNSQFILITHKKRTMEYADTLYGITMQESGVSKIVSVKLENI